MTKVPKAGLHIATVGGIGFFPWAPGTLASLLTVMLVYAFQSAVLWLAAGLILTLVAGTWAAGEAEKALNCKDPGAIVIDEVAGMLLAAWSLPLGDWRFLAASFVLFRLFDIWKPFPIGRLQALPGGWGVMADDVAAGLLANGLLQLGRWGLGSL